MLLRSRKNRWRLVPAAPATLAVAGCLVMMAGPASLPRADADPIPTASPAPATEATASAQAAATGQPVEVTSQTTETTRVMANPDGSFTMTSDREPVRVQQDGRWTPIDTTLAANPDGSYSPGATTVGLTFSGGGSGPALEIADPKTGNKVAFSWPTSLPAPTIDQDTATYSEVLPGVDLQLTAKANSYSEVLVVRDQAAAQNPALDHLSLTAAATGLSLAKAPNGGLSATDASGATVFNGNAPAMWDSTTDPRVGPAPTADDPGSAKVVPLSVSVPTIDGTARSATATVTLTPPAAALDGPNVTYPVYIDPVLATPDRVDYSVVLSNTASYWNDKNQDLKVGDCTWSDCNGIGVARSYFNFNTKGITRLQPYQNANAHIFAAEVDVYEIHNAAGCTKEPVDLWSAGGITSSTSWPGPPIANLATVSTNLSDTCSTAQPGTVKFQYDADLTARVQSAANSGTTVLTFGLIAHDETDGNQWKRFSTNPQLIVTYNFPPNGQTASGLGIASCNGRVYTDQNTPTLYGYAHDNNNPHTALDLRFTVYPAGSNTAQVISGDVAATDNVSEHWTVSSALPDGNWEYTVQAHFASANTYIDIWTPESSRYAFTVQHTPPSKAPTMVTADFPPNYWGAAADRSTNSVAVDDNGASSIIGFQYVWDAPGHELSPTCAANGSAVAAVGGRASIPVAGEPAGPHTLSVRSYNGALAMGPETSYSFYISSSTGQASSNRIEGEDPALSWAGTASQTMTDLYRYLGPNDHATGVGGGTMPTGYVIESALGLLSTSQVPNTTALYDCLNGADHFTSQSATCEGKPTYRQLGYVYLTQPAGLPTHPVYRCLASEHFDSLSFNCEGYHQESVLGYALDQPATGTPALDSASSGYRLRFMPAAALNQQFSFTFTAPITADYGLGGLFYTGPTNGSLTFTLTDASAPANTISLGNDGNPGAPVNTYATAAGEAYAQLGGASLQGSHTYTITATVSAAGTTGGLNFNSGLDYLTLAPVTDVTATPNNHGIAAHDNATTTADLSGTGQALSATALAGLGISPGATYQAGPNGPSFLIPDAAPDGSDNILSDGSVLHMPKPLAGATQLNLLVANTGALTPVDTPNYVVSTIDSNSNRLDHQLPAIPNWLAASSGGVVISSGVDGGTRSLAATMSYYDSGPSATPVTAGVSLYLITIPITATATLTDILLPSAMVPGDSTKYALHILAASTS